MFVASQALCVTARGMSGTAGNGLVADGYAGAGADGHSEAVDEEFLAQLEAAVRSGVYGAAPTAQPTVATMQL